MSAAELRQRAQAATRGPWQARALGSEGYVVTAPQGSGSGHRLRAPRVARFGHEEWEVDKANAEYVAAMDPDTCLALLGVIDEALEAIRLTQEYVQLPAIDGWSWWDFYRMHRPEDADRLRAEWERHEHARLINGGAS